MNSITQSSKMLALNNDRSKSKKRTRNNSRTKSELMGMTSPKLKLTRQALDSSLIVTQKRKTSPKKRDVDESTLDQLTNMYPDLKSLLTQIRDQCRVQCSSRHEEEINKHRIEAQHREKELKETKLQLAETLEKKGQSELMLKLTKEEVEEMKNEIIVIKTENERLEKKYKKLSVTKNTFMGKYKQDRILGEIKELL